MSDLISRQALRSAMYHEVFDKDTDDQRWDSGCWIRYRMFERIIDSIPSATPERNNGKWIPVDGRMVKEVKCSCCGTVFWYWLTKFKYCPKCGAEMEVEHDH